MDGKCKSLIRSIEVDQYVALIVIRQDKVVRYIFIIKNISGRRPRHARRVSHISVLAISLQGPLPRAILTYNATPLDLTLLYSSIFCLSIPFYGQGVDST